ncbi:MAG: hypothetical protein KBC11_00840 [Candidatus Pacebacteria bacterium]|nr:hypothetical protein [Candidatus Paceibacterota bacterium]
MKKFFYILFIVVLSVTFANAQTVEQKSFIAQIFPSYMPEYIFQNSEIIPVDEAYAKEHKKDIYWHNDLKGSLYQGKVRVGDTLFVFNGQPFFSKGQNVFMNPVEKEKTVKTKKVKAPKAPKQPKSQEQKQQEKEVLVKIIQTGTNILTTRKQIGGYSGSNYRLGY